MDDRRRDGGEELVGPPDRAVAARGDDLRQRTQLFERLPFGDPLGAERDVDRAIRGDDQALDHGGDARVHSAAQNEVLSVSKVFEQTLDREQDVFRIGVGVLVDRRADDQDDVLGVGNRRRIARRLEPVGFDQPLQQLVGAAFPEGHLPGLNPADRVGIAVVQRDREADVGEHEAEREPDSSATADDGNVACESHVPPVSTLPLNVERTEDTRDVSRQERALRRRRGRSAA